MAGPKYPCASAGSTSRALVQHSRASSELPAASSIRPRFKSASGMPGWSASASRYRRVAFSDYDKPVFCPVASRVTLSNVPASIIDYSVAAMNLRNASARSSSTKPPPRG